MKSWQCDGCGTFNSTPRCSGCKKTPYLIIDGKGTVEVKSVTKPPVR